MKYEAVIFDLDGTLLDTIDDLSNSMNAVLSRAGFPTHDSEAYKYFIGNGLINLVRNALPEGSKDEDTVKHYLAEMRKEYSGRWDERTRPYEGIPELLDGLVKNGMKLTVLSNKADEFTKLMVEKLLPKWNFEIVLGERPGVPRKPDPSSALEIASTLGVSPERFLYLGDSGVDMKTAKAAGMYAVGALWGFRQEDELRANGADTLISRPEEMLSLL